VDEPRRYVVAYDISDDARRDRLARTLGTYGDRVQYSVFLVDLRPAKLVRMRAELEQLIEPGEDSVLLCDLGLVRRSIDQRRFQVLGRQRQTTSAGALIL
jgi:CRISPR-associated protein Cas2